MELRTLEIDPYTPSLQYQYKVCTQQLLGFICLKQETKRETWDLTDPAVRSALINKGFIVRVRDQIK